MSFFMSLFNSSFLVYYLSISYNKFDSGPRTKHEYRAVQRST